MFEGIHLSAATWVDVIVLAVLAVSVIVGIVRGLACECGRLAGVAVALVLVWVFYNPLRARLFPKQTEVNTILSIVTIVVLSVSVGSLVRWIFARFLRLLVGQPADSVLGACFSVASVGIVILAVFTVLRIVPVEKIQTTVFEQSRTGRLAAPLIEHFINTHVGP